MLERLSHGLKAARQMAREQRSHWAVMLLEVLVAIWLVLHILVRPIGDLKLMRLSYFQQAMVRGCGEPATSAPLEHPRQMRSAAHVQALGDPGRRHGCLRKGVNRRLEFELGAGFAGACGFALVLALSQMREHRLGPFGRADLHPRLFPSAQIRESVIFDYCLL